MIRCQNLGIEYILGFHLKTLNLRKYITNVSLYIFNALVLLSNEYPIILNQHFGRKLID